MVSCTPTNGMPKISVDARIHATCHVWDAPHPAAAHSHPAAKKKRPVRIRQGFHTFASMNACAPEAAKLAR
jgi:hypothetical protein